MPFRHWSQTICMYLGYLESSTVFELEVIYRTPNWKLTPMTQIYSQELPLLSHVEELEVEMSSLLVASQWGFSSD
jgi:hypothetical protein